MKKTKIILVAALGICMLSFMPTVLGKADVRPIEAFTDTNDYVAAWLDPVSNLMITPHGFWFFPGVESIADCEHSGSVLVKELKDGGILYKVNLHVKGAWMVIVYYGAGVIFEGFMDYYFAVTMIVYEAELGDALPNLCWDIWFADPTLPPIGESPTCHITGSGTGTFNDLAEDLGLGISGETAKVKVNQIGLFNSEFWPVELVFFH
ncbi:MAG: hypothetical protein ACTSQL_08235 [Promethearchaeota archaeon]